MKNIFEGCPPLPSLSPLRRLVVDIKMLGDNIIKLCIKMYLIKMAHNVI